MVGIGVAIYLVLFSITPFEWATIGIVVGVGAVLGFLWGMFAPAKQVREMPQADHQPMFTRVSPDDPNPASYEQAFGSSTSSRGAFAADSAPAPAPAPPSAEPDPAPPAASPADTADSPADTADGPADTADELAFGAGEEPPTTDT